MLKVLSMLFCVCVVYLDVLLMSLKITGILTGHTSTVIISLLSFVVIIIAAAFVFIKVFNKE